MGLVSFIQDAGEKLFGASEAKAATAEDLKKEVEKHGFNTKDLDVKVEGNKVTVKGNAATTEEAEKILLTLGNTLGVAGVENDLSVDKASKEASFYTVVKGDTLWKIAETNYGPGKGAHFTAIFEANKPLLINPDKIYPGQVLRIPPLG